MVREDRRKLEENKMRLKINPRRIIPFIAVFVIIIIVAGYYIYEALASNGEVTLSGTIEATEIHLGTKMGGSVDTIYVDEGDQIRKDETLVEVHPSSGSSREIIRAPISGVVLDRLVEPGEVVAAGASILIVTNLDDLTLTVYVPEDRYGQINLGQKYQVTVDSFPNLTFTGVVSHIADQAEFTPRNVQTIDSRKNTVFAIKLKLAPSGGKLKPGMPADVHFQVSN
jgi:multidrug resistance efflux pump